MPAIRLEQLQKQSSLLMEQYENPENFTRSLLRLFESYADNIHRPGQSGVQSPLTSSFKIKPPVIRQIIKDLTPLVNKDPTKALVLCDYLWGVPIFEIRLTAATVLGKIRIDPPDLILNRIHNWIQKDTEDLLLDVILKEGLENLQYQHPDVFYDLVNHWLSKDDLFFQKIGLRSLLTHVEIRWTDNIPVIFRLILPFCRELPSLLYPDLSDILRILARQSPSETAYFLMQTMRLPNSPDTPWIIRQVLSAFPDTQKSELRNVLKEWRTQKL